MSASESTTSRQPANLTLWIVIGCALLVIVVVLLFAWAMLSPKESLATNYGRVATSRVGNSVNGVGVLAKIFQLHGHKTKSATQLSPRVLESEIMVWAPDSFEPPKEEVRDYVFNWFDYHSGRTFIYIGRDFDAAVEYWRDIHDKTDDTRVRRVEREGAFAEAGHLKRRFAVADGEDEDWFVTDTTEPPRRVKKLTGDWAEGVDAAKTDIELDLRLKQPKTKKDSSLEFETLLEGDGEPLVTRITRDDGPGEILIVQNGSFLLNYPLVNHEHRKLADKLVEHCGLPGKVTFLESGEAGLNIVEQPGNENFNAFAVIRVWPINLIMLHAALLGVLYCFARYPIFGRPRTLPVESTADFGTHVTALGQLLGRTKNATFAQQRLMHYRQQGQRKSGASHRSFAGMKK
jgi:hypothetical protein